MTDPYPILAAVWGFVEDPDLKAYQPCGVHCLTPARGHDTPWPLFHSMAVRQPGGGWVNLNLVDRIHSTCALALVKRLYPEAQSVQIRVLLTRCGLCGRPFRHLNLFQIDFVLLRDRCVVTCYERYNRVHQLGQCRICSD